MDRARKVLAAASRGTIDQERMAPSCGGGGLFDSGMTRFACRNKKIAAAASDRLRGGEI